MLPLGFEIDHDLAKAGILLIPATLALLCIKIAPPSYFARVGVLLAGLWTLPALILLNIFAQNQGWWRYAPSTPEIHGIPLELLLGWAILWGVLLPLLMRVVRWWVLVLAAVGLDLLVMPLVPVFELGRFWLLGEAMMVSFVLLPALAIYHLTTHRKRVGVRGLMQAIIWGAWVLFLIPEIILLRQGDSTLRVFALSGLQATLFWNAMIFAAGIGLAGLHEFIKMGQGTPIPFDPPQALVTTGPYAYIANPMQVSTALMFVVMAVSLRSVWLLAPLVALLIYTEGFVRWHHRVDIATRLPGWVDYKAQVRNWWPRWRPYAGNAATTYHAKGCQICEDMKTALGRLPTRNVTFAYADSHPVGGLSRMTFRPDRGPEDTGIGAVLRVFEATNLAVALPCWFLRLPPCAWLIQVVLDGTATRAAPTQTR